MQTVSGGDERHLDGVEWADLDHGDRLLFARKGVLCAAQLDDNDIDIKTVADLNGERPTDQPPPARALRW
jgi:hypothetical protein